MWPYLGPVKTYGPVYLVSIFAYFVIAILIARRLRLKWPIPLIASTSYLFGMTLGAKALFDIQHGDFSFAGLFSAHHFMQGGMWGGPLACLGLAVPLMLITSRNRRAALDLVALSLPIPLAIAKIACLCNGCCYGNPSSLPWAITFPAGSSPVPGGVPVHPTQVYEMIVLVLAAIILFSMNRPQWRGTLLFWFLAFYGIGRPLAELFRGDLAQQARWGPFTQSQWLCAAASVVSICVLVLHRLWAKPEPQSSAVPLPDPASV